MATKRWICSGTCGANLSVEEYEKSGKVCQDPACENWGKPFVEAETCEVCGEVLREGETHNH